jgi:hypothetical protein
VSKAPGSTSDTRAWNRGTRLRARREALGRSLEDLAKTTRIPVQHLEAIEDGRMEDLPAGPYAAAWVRTLRTELGVEEPSEEAAAAAVPPQGAPLWVVRALAVSSLFALFVVLLSFGWERIRPMIGTGGGPVSELADQQLELTAKRSTVVKVTADGAVLHDGEVSGGESKTFDARDRIDLEVRSLADLTLRWNGEELVPQGVQDAPRRLVFVDDAGGAEWPRE